MDTCIWVIGVGVLELKKNSVGPDPSRLAQSVLNSLGARFDGTVVLSTRSVILERGSNKKYLTEAEPKNEIKFILTNFI